MDAANSRRKHLIRNIKSAHATLVACALFMFRIAKAILSCEDLIEGVQIWEQFLYF